MKKIIITTLASAFLLLGCMDNECKQVHHTEKKRGGCNFVFEDGSIIFVRDGSCSDSFVFSDSSEWGVRRRSYQTKDQCSEDVESYKEIVKEFKKHQSTTDVKTVEIDGKVWMASNLNVETNEGSYCFDDDASNCDKFGRLYTWAAAMKLNEDCNVYKCEVSSPHQGLCPDGFHIPEESEFQSLLNFVGSGDRGFKDLIATEGWKGAFGSSNTDVLYRKGSSKHGFNALMSGVRNSEKMFNTYYSTWGAYYWGVDSYMEFDPVGQWIEVKKGSFNRNKGYSLRCIKNSNEELASSKLQAHSYETEATSHEKPETLKDKRDGKTYKTVKIGQQVWMAQNMNYKTDNSWCYDNKPANCQKNGRLYNWDAAMKACPAGWRLPYKEDFQTLWNAVGGEDAAVEKLSSISFYGTDDYGFAVLPAGFRDDDGDYRGEGDNAYFWSSFEISGYKAYYWHFGNGRLVLDSWGNKDYGRSVRCLKDSN